MNSEKLQKIDADITKTKSQISRYTSRLRALERLKTATENLDIVALVRGVDILPDELMEFIKLYKEQLSDDVNLADNPPPSYDEKENLWEQLKKSFPSSPPD